MAIARNWTMRAEYLFLNFGSISTVARVVNTDIAPNDPNLLMSCANLAAHIARVGISFRP
jgi:hypothetical protein